MTDGRLKRTQGRGESSRNSPANYGVFKSPRRSEGAKSKKPDAHIPLPPHHQPSSSPSREPSRRGSGSAAARCIVDIPSLLPRAAFTSAIIDSSWFIALKVAPLLPRQKEEEAAASSDPSLGGVHKPPRLGLPTTLIVIFFRNEALLLRVCASQVRSRYSDSRGHSRPAPYEALQQNALSLHQIAKLFRLDHCMLPKLSGHGPPQIARDIIHSGSPTAFIS